MSIVREPVSIFSSTQPMEGAGVRLKRAFGHAEAPRLDPFLLLDDIHSNNPEDYVAGFPWHPHRGIETVTYVLHRDIEHGDSIGNRGAIGDGDVQWMTAGSGIVHQEMPQTTIGDMRGLQLWINLPASIRITQCSPILSTVAEIFSRKSESLPLRRTLSCSALGIELRSWLERPGSVSFSYPEK